MAASSGADERIVGLLRNALNSNALQVAIPLPAEAGRCACALMAAMLVWILVAQVALIRAALPEKLNAAIGVAGQAHTVRNTDVPRAGQWIVAITTVILAMSAHVAEGALLKVL